MTIQAIIFDIGGVLNKVRPDASLRTWETRLGLAEGSLLPLVFNTPLSHESSLGRVTREQIWQALSEQFHLPLPEVRRLEADIWGCYWWDKELLTLARSLRPRYKTAILSNAWEGARQEMQAYINEATFDVIVYSSEEGLLKPDPQIYLRALQRLGVTPAEAVFIDDLQRNVDGATALGIRGIVFSTSDALRAAIERIEITDEH